MFWEQKKICYLCLLAVNRVARVRGSILRNTICHNLQTIILFTLLPAAPPHQHLFWYHYFTILWTNKKSNNNTRNPGLSTPSTLYSLYTMTMGVTLWSAESSWITLVTLPAMERQERQESVRTLLAHCMLYSRLGGAVTTGRRHAGCRHAQPDNTRGLTRILPRSHVVLSNHTVRSDHAVVF